MSPGSRLPSVREVARAAAVNPMTVSKAYSLLEAKGVVRRVRGQGMEVLPPPGGTVDLADRDDQFRELIRPALHRGRQLGLTRDQMLASIHALLEDLSR
jgi:GntR family transcriptional regulator